MSEEEKSAQDEDFEQLANENARSFIGEFVDFLRDNKKWWLTPIVVSLLLLGALIALSGTAVAPFIYTLF